MGVVPKVTRDKENVPAYQVKLEKVLGLTVANNAGLDCDPNSERVAYPAGCTVVLLDTLRGRQCHILNASKKTITCVGFSSDGRYMATGECGHCPSLRLWDLQDHTMVADLAGHKYSINCLAFSPTQKYVVSVGSQHDMIVNVWDWRSGVKVASNKVSTKVKAISFAENGTYFVTVGNRHVKFWYLDYHRGSKYKDPVPLMGRSAILGEQRNNDFVDVACGRGRTADSTYTITRSGLLCEFNNRRLLDKWVELRTTSANCMTLGEHRIFIGCADGIVRCFDPHTLQFITTLPRTHYLGVDVAQGLNITHMASHPNKAKYPDAIAVAYDEKNSKLTCVYNDRSLYVWDVRDIKRVGKSHSYLYHSACIWGVEIYPEGSHANVPPGSFVTCSSDDTIRVWNIDSEYKTQQDGPYQRNIYSNELIKVIYVDPELACLKDIEVTGEKSENPSAYDGKNGVRALRISPDGKHMASGDRAGNIRVHDVRTLDELCLIEAHDAEVLCLEYNRQLNGKKLLASASRDRLVHVFDVDEDYNFLQTLDDHSSSITAVRFLYHQQALQMVSCGADKSIIFRQLQTGSDGQIQFCRVFNAAGKATLYDMEVDVSQKHVLTACQDRNIRIYNVSSGKHTKTFKGSVGEEGSLIKVALDASGIYVATSCTDKTLCIYDYYSGECMATMSGHSELVTGLRFSQDCSRLISASGDGCVLIWTVPHDMVVTMKARLSQQASRNKAPVKLTNGHADPDEFAPPSVEVFDPNANQPPNFRYSIGQLPVWAKKQLDSGDMGAGERRVSGPKGKWAHRIDHSGITIKSFYENDSIIPFPGAGEKRLDSDGSKEDSSVDSGAETGRSLMSNSRKENITVTKTRDTSIDFLHCPESLNEIIDAPQRAPISSRITVSRGSSEVVEFSHLNKAHHTDDSSLGSFKFEDVESTEHDGDIEDYSEGESSDTRRPLYVPSLDEPDREFPVTNIDSTELRKSMKKSRRPDLLLVASEMSSASRSMSGSQSDDDDHATTPTSDHTHSVGSDALDVIAHREKFLKNNFESLSGAEDTSVPIKKGKRSLSSQHHVGQGVRNANLIQAAKSAKNDGKSKREELQRRIQETRRQLQSVGYRSNLKASQSIQDLSMRGMYGDSRKVTGPRHKIVQQVEEDLSGGIRRACSLSDLTKPAQRPKPTSSQVSGKASNQVKSVTRHSTVKSSSMMRSSSVGVLNQSDSESELSQSTGQRSLVSLRVMRPTISSQNKVATTSATKARMEARRRGLSGAYSSIALNQAGNTEDSSSEENQAPAITKPTPPPRPKSVNLDRPGARRTSLGRSGSERDLNRIGPSKIQKTGVVKSSTVASLDPSAMDLPVKDLNPSDVNKVPLSQDLVESMAVQLQKAADSVIELHKRLCSQPMDPSQREALLAAIGETQKKLDLVARKDM